MQPHHHGEPLSFLLASRVLTDPQRESSFGTSSTGGHGASTKAVYYLFNKHLRYSGVPGEALKRKLKKDISFALRRGTIAQVTTALDAAQRAADAELTVNEVGLAW